MPRLEGMTGMEAEWMEARLEGMKGRLEWKRNAWVGRNDWDGRGMDGSGMPG
jgi:hypothetical protein